MDNTAWIHLQRAGMMNSLLSGGCGPHLLQPYLFIYFLECDQPTSQRKKQESVMELQLAVCLQQRFPVESQIRMK